jgi:hypothetical protein
LPTWPQLTHGTFDGDGDGHERKFKKPWQWKILMFDCEIPMVVGELFLYQAVIFPLPYKKKKPMDLSTHGIIL